MSGAPVFSRVKLHSKNHCFLTVPRTWRIKANGNTVATFSLERPGRPHKLFASWSGELSEGDFVGVNHQLASSVGLKDGEEVILYPVSNLVKCFQVTLEPVSPEDWQVLHMNLNKVQNGLLHQLRVFSKNLEFPFFVHAGFPIHLRVVSTQPDCAPLELCQTTDVHIVPKENPKRASASTTPSAQSTSLPGDMSPNEPPNDSSTDVSKISLKARLHGTIEAPQTEVLLVSNSVEEGFVGLLRRLNMPSDSENRKLIQGSAAISPDGCFPLNGGTVCYVRVENNSWSDENELYCPLPLRKRLGLEDCCVVSLQILEEQFDAVKKLSVNPIINPTCCPRSCDVLGTVLRDELSRRGSLIVTPGTYLELQGYGIIVNVEKTGWLRADTKFSVEFGRDLCRHNIENATVPVPVEDLRDIIEQGSGLAAIGGYESFVEELVHEIRDACVNHLGVHKALLVTAAEGVGKTYMIETILSHLRQTESVYWKTISCSGQRGKRTETVAKEWQKTFTEARSRSPSVIFFDNLDTLCGIPTGQDGGGGADSQYISKNSRAFIEFVEVAKRIPERVLILASAKSWSGLCDVLTKNSNSVLFNETIEIKPPSAAERAAIFKVHADKSALHCEDPNEVGRQTEGFVGRDITTLVKRMRLKVSKEGATELTEKILKSAIKSMTPTALRGLRLADKSEAPPDWDSVGGLSEQKRILRETFLWPTLYPHLMKQCPIRLVSGILLYGMPGTGKTRLASCLARENRINFISVKGPELLSKYVGASELAVRDLFQRAKSAAPCVIFFDEFDSMAPRRGHDSTGVTDRCVNQLLTLLDGVETEGGVAVLAATSRPELIDPALLRPGRFDRCIECSLPRTAEERKAILTALSESVPLDDNCYFDEVAAETTDFSGADLQALLFNAQLAAVQEIVQNVSAGDSEGALSTRGEELDFSGKYCSSSRNEPRKEMTRPTFEAMPESDRREHKVLYEPLEQHARKAGVRMKLRPEHLKAALAETHPSLSQNEINRFSKIYHNFRNGGVDSSEDLKARVTWA